MKELISEKEDKAEAKTAIEGIDSGLTECKVVPPPETDTWDSVKQQLDCKVCNMVFDTGKLWDSSP